MAEQTIRIVGLTDLRRGLRQIDRELPKELAAGLAGAAEIVADAARSVVPWLTGAARKSMTVRKQQRAAALAVGGTGAPYYPWLDFGGRVGRNRSVHRPVIRGGRYIYPTLAAKSDEVKATIDEVLMRLARRAGFDQSGRSDHGP